MLERTHSAVELTAIREASSWYARLISGTATEQEQQQWQEWHQASTFNQRAWQAVEAVRHQLGRVPGNIAAPALSAAFMSRRNMLRSMVVITTGSVAWASWRALPWQDWSADYHTATGERREIALADGSQLFINTRSAVDVVFDASRRMVRLHSGEILIQTAKDPNAFSRPFVVETSHGEVLALGTRFNVRVDEGQTRVSVLEKAVRVQPIYSQQSIVVEAGKQLSFSMGSLGDIQRYDPFAVAWTQGSLIVIDMPLGQVVAELARYRPGFLFCDSNIASLKVSGTFPLDDTDRALAALTHGFPVQIISRTRYWITLISLA